MRDLKHLQYFEDLLQVANNELIAQAKAANGGGSSNTNGGGTNTNGTNPTNGGGNGGNDDGMGQD